MKTVWRWIQDALADQLGCGDCTMREDWVTCTVQLPETCELDGKYAICPVYGKKLGSYQKVFDQVQYLFIDGKGDSDGGEG